MTQSTRVMAITASVMGSEREKVRSAGFDAFEPKPINLRAFLQSVANLLKPGQPRYGMVEHRP